MADAGPSRLAEDAAPSEPDCAAGQQQQWGAEAEAEVPFDKLPVALVLPPTGVAGLPGRASDPFQSRLNRARATFTGGAWLALVLGVAVLLRCASCTTPLTAAWLLAYCCLAAGTLLWARLERASFARWREVPAALLGLLSFGLGLGWLQTRRLLDEISAHWVHLPHDAGQGGGAEALDLARHAALLAFASGAVGMCALAFSLRTRVSICPLVWFAVAATAAPYARHICAAPALSSPAAQRAAHSLYQMASWLGYSPLPVALLVQPSAADECVTLMVALQFGAGALVPLLANAVGEARLFQHHQRQRWLARLPLERGAQAEAYDWIWWVTLGGDRGATALVWFMVLSTCWSISALLCSQAGS